MPSPRSCFRPAALAWRFLLLGGTALAVGCRGDGPPDSTLETVQVRDSAGVRIVENPAGPVDTVRVGEPLLTIGREGDSRYEFDGIRFVAGLADGRVVVVDQGARGIRYYGADGAYLGTVGGAGEGPGEFAFVSSAELLKGDTVAVNDSNLRRVSFMAPDMSFVTSVSYLSQMDEMDEDASQCVFPGYVGVVRRAPRTFALRSWACVFARGVEGPNSYEYDVTLWEPESGREISVASMPLFEGWERPSREGIERFLSRRFSAGSMPVAREGGVLVASHRAHAVSVYGSDGSHRMEIRDAEPRRPTSRAHREGWTATQEEDRLALYEGVPFPDSLPAFVRSLSGDRRIWALHYDVPGRSGEHWRVYEEDGRRRHVVAFPPGFELRSVREGRAYGFHRDELGVQRPRVYRLSG